MGKGASDGDELVAAFARWAADERVHSAARERSRERWLRQQAVEEATLAGVLIDLAERRAEVVVTTRSRQFAGRVVGVAKDFFVLEDRGGAGVLVVTTHAVTVGHPAARSGPAERDPSGDRQPPLTLGFVDALALLAGDRSPVGLALDDGSLVTGEIAGVGLDVVTLRSEPLERGRGPARGTNLSVVLSGIEACMPR